MVLLVVASVVAFVDLRVVRVEWERVDQRLGAPVESDVGSG